MDDQQPSREEMVKHIHMVMLTGAIGYNSGNEFEDDFWTEVGIEDGSAAAIANLIIDGEKYHFVLQTGWVDKDAPQG